MWILLGSVVLASMLGSLHCIGMCGGFVAFYAGGDQSKGWERSFSHLAYNGGRLLTYSLLGAMVGLAGAVVDFAGTAAGMQHITAIIAGVLMIGWGILMISHQWGLHWKHLRLPLGFQQRLIQWQRSLKDKPPVWRALFLGLISTLLPCGWLYAFAVTAAATASPWKGALVMAAFWVGTVPALLGLGLGIHTLSVRLRRHFPWISATAIILIGISTIWQRSTLLVPIPSQGAVKASTNPDANLERVKQLHKKKPSCCGGKKPKQR
ncbi:MAG: sulfite exporter TauE/SafE family protein [Deltaproteobacteria bacterium]|nr:MAG: sulfite exporter TauE/SafE family protein [Deltaproteobacteria bacterium]